MEEPKIYNYSNYRKYLQSYIAYRRELNPSYSIHALSRSSKGISRSLLSLVINGKRNLTKEKQELLVDALKLSLRERRYFDLLVRLGQSSTAEEKQKYLQATISFLNRANSNIFVGNATEVLKNWHCVAVLELLRISNDQNSVAITKRLKNRIRRNEVEAAIAILLKHGFLQQSKNGKLLPVKKQFRSSDELYDLSIQQYHLSCMKLAQTAIVKDEVEKREFQSITFPIKHEKVPEIKEQIKEFVGKLLQANSTKAGDQIGQLNVNFFTVSEVIENTDKRERI